MSLRSRARRLWRRAAPHLGVPEAAILMYHRVVDLSVDPWKLAVSPTHFAEQVEALKRTRTVVPLADLPAALDRWKRGDRPLAVVTFDDGYLDVDENARPALERLDCPATMFMPTRVLDEPRGFWWDALAAILLSGRSLPATLSLTIDGDCHDWIVPHDAAGRSAVYVEVWRLLRARPHEERWEHLAILFAWSGMAPIERALDPVMTAGQVAGMAAGGLFAIGAHTDTHPSLPDLTADEQRREIAESRRRNEEIVGGPVNTFAYPFGDYDRETLAALEATGFALSVTVEETMVRRNSDPLRLPRIKIEDWPAETFLAVLAGEPPPP